MAKPRRRRLLGSVVQSLLLYSAPNWAECISVQGRKELTKVQRKTALRVASAYSTVSAEASQILAVLPPNDLLAIKRRQLYMAKRSTAAEPEIRTSARDHLYSHWQRRWDNCVNGKWTHRLIPNVKNWHSRRHGEISFHLTQALSGHGCFAAYLFRIGKTTTAACWYCDAAEDSAQHTLFECDAWFHCRRRLEDNIRVNVEPSILVDIMLKS